MQERLRADCPEGAEVVHNLPRLSRHRVPAQEARRPQPAKALSAAPAPAPGGVFFSKRSCRALLQYGAVHAPDGSQLFLQKDVERFEQSVLHRQVARVHLQ